MRVIIYSRVSTEKQDPKAQLQALLDYAKRKGYKVEKIFEENVSGSVPPLERPVFRQAIEYAKEHGIHVILLYDLTRFYRAKSPAEALQEMRNIMKEHGIIFDFVNEPEISDPFLKELLEFLKLWYASLERQQISVRTSYGLKKLKAEGRLYHRPSLLHYYTAYIFNKPLKEVTDKEIEIASKMLYTILKKYFEDRLIKKTAIPELLARNELRELYIRFPKATRSYSKIRALYVKLARKFGEEPARRGRVVVKRNEGRTKS